MRGTNSNIRFGHGNCIGAIAWAFSAYPVLLLLSLYTTWALAWLSLGHLPRPTLDDPKYINRLVTCFNLATWLLLMGIYIALPLNAFFVLVSVTQRVLYRQWNVVLIVGTPTLLWLCLFFLLVNDPGKIVFWFFD